MSGWTTGPGRFWIYRWIEVPLSVAGLVVTAPIIVAAALLVRLSSPGPAFFRQTRLGRGAGPFRIIKIRTMTTERRNTPSARSTVTVDGDTRLTAHGRWLRAWKIDELPQLVNVLFGHMSLVGPRPDVPGFADELQGNEARVLDVRPGITGPATLLLSREQAYLTSFDDPENVNRYVLFPAKTELNLAWMKNGSLLDDLKIVAYTVLPNRHHQLRRLMSAWEPGLLEQGALGKVIDHLDLMEVEPQP